ncbi:MAG TPA: DUF4159 domain-containing protein, partial [Tepidisphaeraceae bacterium]
MTLFVPIAPRDATAATPEQVNQSIEKARQFLLSKRNDSGTWEEVPRPDIAAENAQASTSGRQWGGLTALSTYALLASGTDWRSPDVTPAIEFLLHANIEGTYALGASSQLLLYLPPDKAHNLLRHNLDKLSHGMHPAAGAPARWPPEVGFYGYWTGDLKGTPLPLMEAGSSRVGRPQPGDWSDRSNSQYGVLGMWALEQAGADIPANYWRTVDTAWKRAQDTGNGGWSYRNAEPNVSAAMTAAGIATLFITQDYTLDVDFSVCRGGIKNPALDKGIAFMDQHMFDAMTGSYYTLYGLERVGAASGRRFFGGQDWFRQITDLLVSQQKEDGSWHSDRGAIPDTCFGLLFLSRGRAPVLMNKLDYQPDDKNLPPEIWNQRPRDVANLATWCGRQLESFFNWQVVDLKLASDQLHEAPILYIGGSRSLKFSDDQKKTLRQYVSEGGIILGNADCAQSPFTDSFKKLGKDLFPRYEFHDVPANDLLWREQYTQWRTKPKVLELTNGARKLMILIPEADASRAWQVRADRNREPLLQLAGNIYLYAVDKRNRYTRDQTYLIKPQDNVKITRKIRLARLDLGDNPDPEPGGWTHLAAVMRNRFKIELQTDFVKPEELGGYKVAHLTGSGALALTTAQRATIKFFVQSGGLLLIDAAGGSIAFADSVQTELETMFGAGKLTILPPNHALFTRPELKIETIGWRPFALDHVADHKHPNLRAVTLNNRAAVIFSREDLSTGLV